MLIARLDTELTTNSTTSKRRRVGNSVAVGKAELLYLESVTSDNQPASGSAPRDLRTRAEAEKKILRESVESGRDGIELGEANSARLDALLRDHFERVAETTAHYYVVLAAVGSHGRGVVALESDADVRIIGKGRANRLETFADAFFYPLWDGGVSIGHQVLSIDEAISLARDDLASATSLLDLRTIAGEASVTTELRDRAFRGVFEEAALGGFLDRLIEEAQSRHARFGGSIYLLEPDVKAGAGGLRDLQKRWSPLGNTCTIQRRHVVESRSSRCPSRPRSQ